MLNRKLVIGVSLGAALLATLSYVFLSKEEDKEVVQPKPVVEQKAEPSPQVHVKKVHVSKPAVSVKKVDLYNSTDKNLPLSAIVDLSNLSDSAKHTILELLNESSSGIYFLKQTEDKIIAIIDLSPEAEENAVKRHDFNFLEISASNGEILNTTLEELESKFDKWKYQNDLPLSHTHYNSNKEIEYTETWNYSEDDPIKYKKSDKDGQVISLRKEVVDNGINLREEHLFYDNEGNMTKNVSFNYDGIDLTRFTYYNSQDPEDSAMIVSEYEDGIKTKETLYSSDYKVKNIYIPEYDNGQKSEIKVLDKDNKLVETLQSF